MRIELLPIGRWGEVERALKESRSDEQIPKPAHSIILSAFDGERMIGCIGATKSWVVSPFWIEKESRGNGLAKQLAMNLALYNTEKFQEMCITTNPHVEKLIFDMNFVPLKGQLWRREIGK